MLQEARLVRVAIKMPPLSIGSTSIASLEPCLDVEILVLILPLAMRYVNAVRYKLIIVDTIFFVSFEKYHFEVLVMMRRALALVIGYVNTEK